MKIKYLLFIFFIIFNISFANEILKIDKNKIKLEADSITIYKDKSEIKLVGNVVVNSGNIYLYAENMQVNYININNYNEISKISGNNNVILKNENINATSNKFLYEPNKQIVTMYEDVVLKEKDSVVYGDKLTYNLKTGDSSIDSTNNTKKERVKIIINDIDSFKSRYDK